MNINSASDQHTLQDLLSDELDRAMTGDQKRLGSVYRCIKLGMNDEEIMRELGLATVGSIGHAKRSIKAIRDGWNPPGFHPAMIAKNDLGRLLREFNFAESVREILRNRYEALEANLEQIREDKVVETPQDEFDDGQSQDDAIAGVYIWTIDSYRENEDDRGQVWYRIGCSDDVHQRMRDHRANIKLPEPVVLMRVISHPTLSPRQLETQIHDICTLAAHERARVNNRDREWFRTNVEFIDKYIRDIGCVNHFSASDED